MMMMMILLIICLLLLNVNGLITNSLKYSRSLQLNALKEVAKVGEIKDGDRKIIETEAGAVIVTNLGGSFYAVNAKCPHLGLPMKTGNLEIENGIPTITCKFHNSKFNIENGKCTTWCSGVMGVKNEFLGGVMGSIGGAKESPATTYKVTVTEDQKIMIDM